VQYYGVYEGGDQPTVGYTAEAVLDSRSPQRAIRISFGNPQADVSGTVVDVDERGQSVTVEVLRKKDAPLRRTIQIAPRTRVLFIDIDADAERRQPALGDQLEAWLEPDSDAAVEIRFGFDQKGKLASDKALKQPKQESPMKASFGELKEKPKSQKTPAGNGVSEKPTPENPKSKESFPAKSFNGPNKLTPPAAS
jgi:hypothetical protein